MILKDLGEIYSSVRHYSVSTPTLRFHYTPPVYFGMEGNTQAYPEHPIFSVAKSGICGFIVNYTIANAI